MKNPCHTELAWILSCMSPFGRLRRMTTWKVNTFRSLAVSCLIALRQSRLAASRNVDDESKMTESFLNVGLFIYPILQAADILIYKLGVISLRFSPSFIFRFRATHVPVGDDQQQNLELARELATIFNRNYKSSRFFPLPRQVTSVSFSSTLYKHKIMKLFSPFKPNSLSRRSNLEDVEVLTRHTISHPTYRFCRFNQIEDSSIGNGFDPRHHLRSSCPSRNLKPRGHSSRLHQRRSQRGRAALQKPRRTQS